MSEPGFWCEGLTLPVEQCSMERSKTTSRSALASIAISAVLLSGCQTPDLKPFRDSTAKIHNSIVEAQDVYSGELERLRPFVPDDHELTKQEKRFAGCWKARTEVMEAMVKYAGSLAAVADAPDKSEAALESVAQSINELGVVAGPYQQAVEGTTQITLVIVDLVNRVRAAQQLKKAVLATDADMQKLAQLLVRDFEAMRRTLERNQKSIKNLMDGKMSHQIDAREAIASKVEERTEALQFRLDGGQWADAVAAFNKEMAEAQKYLAEADKWYLPHKAEVEAAQKEMAERIRLFRNTETALAQWGKAHGALAEALQKDLAPDWTLLKQAADRIEKSVDKITQKDGKP